MNLAEAAAVIRKVDAVWPLGSDQGDDARNEWLDFLAGLDHAAALAAVTELRVTLKWRPSMAELRSAYGEALNVADVSPPALPGAISESAPTLFDLYGQAKVRWVYCWRCNMAISLADQAGGPVSYAERLGLAHRFCPKSGASPRIPAYLRTEREDYWSKHHVRRPT